MDLIMILVWNYIWITLELDMGLITIGLELQSNWFGQKLELFRIKYGLNLYLNYNQIGIVNDMDWIGTDLIELGNVLE